MFNFKMTSSGTLVFLLLIASVESGTIGERKDGLKDSCATHCTASSKFRYDPGKTYVFEYNVHSQTAMEGTFDEKTSIVIQAVVEMDVLSKCDLSIKFRDVKVFQSNSFAPTKVKDADKSGYFRRVLEEYPLRFSFQDGAVEELCPFEGETAWALNIKRGFLSAIQNTADTTSSGHVVTEKDVAGECKTEYKVKSTGWYSTTIIKTKDLQGCTNRHGYQSSIEAVKYHVPSDIQALPLLKSTYENEQDLGSSGILNSAVVKETHTFRPFAKDNSGAITTVLQKVVYKSVKSGIRPHTGQIKLRTDLYYDHSNVKTLRDGIVTTAVDILKRLCLETNENIRPDTPTLFSDLVRTVKSLDADDLVILDRMIKEGIICNENNLRTRQFFLDSLPMAATDETFKFMKQVLFEGEVDKSLATTWIASFALIEKPSIKMLKTVKELFGVSTYRQMSMLPLTTMVNKFCANMDCTWNPFIGEIITDFVQSFKRTCEVTEKNIDDVILSLRALGNIGHVSSITIDLSPCLNRQSNPLEVRLAAIQAYRRIPCIADRDPVLKVYEDVYENAELRINAFLAMMRCPSHIILREIQETQQYERSNQVGAFVWSHLQNVLESSNPQKQALKEALRHMNFRRFYVNTLTSSKNVESSRFVKEYNVGGSVESNIIFADSHVPRSATFNLTVDLFGHSVNILDIGVRAEGVDDLAREVLSKSSYLKDWVTPTEKDTALKGDMYVRVFGNELFYDRLNTKLSTETFDLQDLLGKVSRKHDYSFSHSAVFLDSSIITPTSSGLPLILTVNGTASVDLKAQGQVDLRKMMSSPRSLLIDGEIQPSGAVKVTGTMSMDAEVAKAGLTVVNTWHTSTSLKGRVELNRGNILSAKLDFPQDKMELLDVSTEFFSIHGDKENQLKHEKDNRATLEICSGGKLSSITGLELCNTFEWSNTTNQESPYFPFTGPFSQSLILHKRDTHTEYTLLAKMSRQRQGNKFSMSLDTPGSTKQRHVDLSAGTDLKNNEVHLDMKSPWKNVLMKGTVANNKRKVGMSGMLTVDTSEYAVVGEVNIKRLKSVFTYSPLVVIKRPGADNIELSGKLQVKGKSNAKLELELEGVSQDKITLNADLSNTSSKGGLYATLKTGPKHEYAMKIGLEAPRCRRRNCPTVLTPIILVKTPTTRLIALTASVSHKHLHHKGSLSMYLHKVTAKDVKIKYGYKHTQKKSNAFATITSGLINAKVKGHARLKKNGGSVTCDVTYDLPEVKKSRNKLKLTSLFSNKSNSTQSGALIIIKYTDKIRPQCNTVATFEFSHSRKQTAGGVTVQYGRDHSNPLRSVTAEVEINHNMDTQTVAVDYHVKGYIGPLDVHVNSDGKAWTRLGSYLFNIHSSNVIEIASGKKIFIQMTGMTNPYTDFSVSVRTPYKGYETINLRASYNLQNSKTRLRFAYQLLGPVISVDVDVSKNKTIIANLLYSSEDKVRVSASSVITPEEIRANVSFTTGEGNISTGLVARLQKKNASLSLDIHTPFDHYNNIGFHVEHRDIDTYSFQISVRYMDGKEISFITKVRSRWIIPIYFLAEVKTPFDRFRIYSFGFDCTEVGKNTTVTWTLMYGNHNKLSLATHFKGRHDSRAVLIFHLTTPYKDYEDNRIYLSKGNGSDYYQGYAKMNIGSKVIVIHANVSKPGRRIAHGDMNVTTNIKGLEVMAGDFYLNRTRDLIATSNLRLNEDKVVTNVSLIDRRGMFKWDISIKTPLENYTSIGGYLHGSRVNNTNHVLLGGITYMDNTTVNMSVTTYSGYRKLEMKCEFRTPFEQYDNQYFILNWNSNGGLRNVSMLLLTAQNEILDVNFKSIFGPINNISIAFRTNRSQGAVEMSFPKHGGYSVPKHFQIKGDAMMPKGPKGNITHLQVQYSHNFSFNEAEVRLELTGNDKDIIQLNVLAEHKDDVLFGKMNISSNIGGDTKFEAMFRGSEDIKNDVEAAVFLDANDERYGSSVRHYKRYAERLLDIKVLNPKSKDVKVMYRRTGQIPDFDHTMHLEVGSEFSISTNTSSQSAPRDVDNTVHLHYFNYSVTNIFTLRSTPEVRRYKMICNWKGKESSNGIQFVTEDRSRMLVKDINSMLTLGRPGNSMTMIYETLESSGRFKDKREIIFDGPYKDRYYYEFEVRDFSSWTQSSTFFTWKIGSSLRRILLEGTVKQSSTKHVIDGSLLWSPGVGDLKKVGVLLESWQEEDSHETRLVVGLPSVGQTYNISNSLTLYKGDTLVLSNTDIRYSEDPRKTLTIIYQLKKGDGRYRNTSYSFAVEVKHPSSKSYLKTISQLGSSDSEDTVGLEVWYQMVNGKKKYYSILGGVDTKDDTVYLRDPNIALLAKIQRSLLHLEATTSPEDQPFSTAFTLGNKEIPQRDLHITAKYRNSSVITAQVHHKLDSNHIYDSSVTTTLIGPHHLQTSLRWTPEIRSELQRVWIERVKDLGEKTKKALRVLYDDVGREFSRRYRQVSKALTEAADPSIRLLKKEMPFFVSQVNSLNKDIEELQSMKNVTDPVDAIIFYDLIRLKQACQLYLSAAVLASEKWISLVSALKATRARRHYDEALSEFIAIAEDVVEKTVNEVVNLIDNADVILATTWDAYYQKYIYIKERVKDSIDTIVDLPTTIDNNLQLTETVSPYVSSLYTNVVPTYGSFEEAVLNSNGLVGVHLDSRHREDLHLLYNITKDAYHKIGLGDRYSEFEDQLTDGAAKIPSIIKDQVKEYARSKFDILVTVWDPHRGEIQMEYPIPVGLKSLDSPPEIKDCKWLTEVVTSYLSNTTALQETYMKYAPELLRIPNRTKRT